MYIYKISNNINNKSYVGKTYKPISERLREHFKDSYDRPLTRAIAKYGPEAFKIELLEVCDDSVANERESYFIARLDTYHNGYNATLGGDGRPRSTLDPKSLVEAYLETSSLKSVARLFSTTPETVARKIRNLTNIRSTGQGVKILDEGISFASVKECAQFLIDSEVSTASIKSTITGISRAISGNRKSYLGITFSAD